VASYFPSVRERDWLRLFVRGLDDERAKYFSARWLEEQSSRAATQQAALVLWRDTVQVALGRYLGNAQLGGGTIIPSFVLEGEGRTVTRSRTANLVVTGLPATVASSWDVAYVLVHEMVATVAAAAVQDHTTPAQQRSGEADAFSALALVRGGALLLEKAIPERVDGYMRFYLASAGRTVGETDDVQAMFASVFEIPAGMLAGMKAQIDVIWGGI
jgi:hypothetical protein